MAKQFAEVNSQYGAPMGRSGYGLPCHREGERHIIRLFRVRLDSGGYDDGGAYWGLGEPVYCATDGEDYRQFTRARNRFDAAALLEIDQSQLRIAAMPDGRYTVQREATGAATLEWVARFMGEPVRQYPMGRETIRDALNDALEHRREMLASMKGAKR